MGKAISADTGTMFFQVAELNENKKTIIKTIRNSFVELEDSEDVEQVLQQNKWKYVKDGDKYYVIGEDSLVVAKMFPGRVELRRPMQDGVLNKGEQKKMLVMAEIIEKAVGQAPDDDSLVCICVSSPSADGSPDSTFHRARLEGMFSRLGWHVKVIDEALAVILSEKPTIIEEDGTESPFSGIAISLGAGRANCVLAYKGLQIIGFSVARCGDFIDSKVADQTDTPISQVTSKKEKKLNFDNIDYDDDVLYALDAYYTSVIEYIFKIFSDKFAEVKSQFETPLDIVIAGGTSMPNGFEKKVQKVISKLNLPFQIKEVRKSKDPRNAVVKGLLTQAIISQKRLGQNKEKKTNDKDI